MKLVAAFCVIGVLAVLLLSYGEFAGTRLIAPTGPRLRVKTGEVQTIQYTTSSRAPSVKIDLCQEKTRPTGCVTLAQKATGKSTNVQIPYEYPLGKALLIVSERLPNGKLSGKTQYRRPLIVLQGPPKPSPTPTPYAGAGGPLKTVVSERVGRRIEVTAPEPMIVGKRVPVTIVYRTKDESGTYRGEMQVSVSSPDVFNIQPSRSDDVSGGYMRWPYELGGGQTFTVTFEVKVPPVSYRGDALQIQAQARDSSGPLVGDTGVSMALSGEWRISEK